MMSLIASCWHEHSDADAPAIITGKARKCVRSTLLPADAVGRTPCSVSVRRSGHNNGTSLSVRHSHSPLWWSELTIFLFLLLFFCFTSIKSLYRRIIPPTINETLEPQENAPFLASYCSFLSMITSAGFFSSQGSLQTVVLADRKICCSLRV